MQGLNVLLLDALSRDERDVWLACRGADRFRVIAVVLLPPHERLDILRADQLDLMPERLELARPIECARAGFDDHRARSDLRHGRQKLIPHHPALQDDAAVAVDAVELEHVLCDIHAEGLDRHLGSPLLPGARSQPEGGRESRPSH